MKRPHKKSTPAKKSASKLSSKRKLLLFVVPFVVLGVFALLSIKAATFFSSVEPELGTVTSPAMKKTGDSTASNDGSVQFGTASAGCSSVSAILEPGCGAWLGAWSNDHGVSGLRANTEEHEARTGKKVSFVHSYHPVGNTSLSADEKYFINRADTYLLTNFKPANTWAQANGSNATTNAQIDAFATSIKSVAPKKVMVMIFHEPENDVSSGKPAGCSSGLAFASGANSGSPAEYRAMWQNTRARFDALGVNNVVWVMNYMSAAKWDCMIKDLWPGNNLVDWVMFNPYPTGSETWNTGIGRFYDWLNNNSDATHAFSSKPYGLGEWGAWHKDQASVYKFYDDGKAALAANRFPKIKLYAIFDAIGVDDSRVSHNDAEVADPAEQAKYNNFVQAPQFNH